MSREAKSLAQGNRARRGQGHGPDSKRDGVVGFLAILGDPPGWGMVPREAGWHREWRGRRYWSVTPTLAAEAAGF